MLSRVWLFAAPCTVVCQAPLSMEFSRQEYWSELPFPSPGESSWPRDRNCVSCIGRWILFHWATSAEWPQTSYVSGDSYCYIYCVLITGTNKLIKKTVYFRMQWLEENIIKNINSDGGLGFLAVFDFSLFSTSYFVIQIILLKTIKKLKKYSNI